MREADRHHTNGQSGTDGLVGDDIRKEANRDIETNRPQKEQMGTAAGEETEQSTRGVSQGFRVVQISRQQLILSYQTSIPFTNRSYFCGNIFLKLYLIKAQEPQFSKGHIFGEERSTEIYF